MASGQGNLGGALNSHGIWGEFVNDLREIVLGPVLRARNVMTDAFYILTSKAIKVGKVLQEEDDIEDPNVHKPSRQVSTAWQWLPPRFAST
jgi:hypothetical protein